MAHRKFERAEAKFGKPMAQILAEHYERFGTNDAVAEALKVTVKTLLRWRERAGCERVAVVQMRSIGGDR